MFIHAFLSLPDSLPKLDCPKILETHLASGSHAQNASGRKRGLALEQASEIQRPSARQWLAGGLA